MKSVEVSAKSKEIAIMDGLNRLGATIDMVKIEVLSEGGLFSKCKLRMTVVEEEEEIVAFVKPQESVVKPQKEEVQKPQQKSAPAPKESVKKEKKDKPEQREKTQKAEVAGKPLAEEREEKREKRVFEKRVREYKDNPQRVEMAKQYYQTLVQKMGYEVQIDEIHEEDQIVLHASGDNCGSIIGFRGETLDSIQTLINQVANGDFEHEKKIVVDCGDYRKNRIEKLEQLALKLADKAIKSNKRMRLEPMNAFERRIIHAALSENKEVNTFSEGRDPMRHIVIVPKNAPQRRYNNRDNRGENRDNRGENRDRRNYDNKQRRQNSSGFGESPSGFISASGFEDNGRKR